MTLRRGHSAGLPVETCFSQSVPNIAIERLLGPVRTKWPATRNQLRDHLAALRQDDFEHGNVVTVAGWILARSEADAIALVSLYRAG